jgi:uncharacterized protein (DUF58 family)
MAANEAEARWLVLLRDLSSRDFFPEFSVVARRWLKNPLAVLSYATVVSVLCGVVLHENGFVVAAGLAVLIVVGVAWPRIVVLGLRGLISFDQVRAREGQPVRVFLSVHNRAPWGVWGVAIRDVLDQSLGASLVHASGARRQQVEWSFTPSIRGEYPRGTPTLSTGFPFGLVVASRKIEVERTVLVWPRSFPVGTVPISAGDQDAVHSRARRRAGGDGEILGVRPYRRGDSLRRVHWPQTARQGSIIVCECESKSVPRVQVVLDRDPLSHFGSGPDSTMEWSLRVVASFVEEWSVQGIEIELVSGTTQIGLRGGSLEARRVALLDSLARFDATLHSGPPLARVLEGPTCQAFRKGLRLIVTTDVGAAGLGSKSMGFGVSERLVVLASGGFGCRIRRGSLKEGPPPWILIESPAQAPLALKRSRKEVALDY